LSLAETRRIITVDGRERVYIPIIGLAEGLAEMTAARDAIRVN
jgi:hypothetical protein